MITVFLVIVMYYLLQIWDAKETEKMSEKARIKRIKDYVTEAFSEIEENSDIFGNDYSESLLDFANKMDKMSSLEVRKDLRPYDIYNVKLLSKKTSSHILGRIVIDKNRIPKFIASAPNEHTRDIELEAALTSDEVRTLAEKCKKLRMDNEIEKFRKDKVNKVING